MTIDEAIELERKQAEMYRCEYECDCDYYGKDFIDDYADELDYIKNMQEHEQYAEWLEELKMYRKLEEQGLLLRLPCKAGSTVYKIITQRDNFDDRAYKIVSAIEFRISMIDEIGKTVFLTKEEAEQKLKEIKGNGE